MPRRLADMQVRAERRMRDTCRAVTLPSGDIPIDPDTGLPPPGAVTLVYEGPCRLRMIGRAATAGQGSSNVAGDVVFTSTPLLHVPVSAPRVPVGAVVFITDVPADDPAGHLRLGLRFRVTGVTVGTDVSAQRLSVETVTG